MPASDRDAFARAGEADLLDVAMVGAAAAAQDVELRQPAAQIKVLLAQLQRIAGIEIRRGVELRMAPPGGVAAQTLDSPGPVALEYLLEVGRVSAIYHGVGGRARGGGIHSFH